MSALSWCPPFYWDMDEMNAVYNPFCNLSPKPLTTYAFWKPPQASVWTSFAYGPSSCLHAILNTQMSVTDSLYRIKRKLQCMGRMNERS